ncbi:MAG TPA: TIR domain-containing protein [Allosphingosinicella sp.]|nr:TIR domain-containing protein [Allosphingosinicella sp.]
MGAYGSVLERPSANARGRRAAPPPAPRYWAFLSYSHSDKKAAEWLHKALESFRVPKDLVGKRTEAGEVPATLRPVFRDREELVASDDLGHTIRDSLSVSRCLIVLCSPAAARSRWTNEEIRRFKQLNPSGRVLAAIVAGEPFASEIPGREEEECFPPALRQRVDSKGRLTGKRAEPIAADLRPEGDGRRMGLLKLIAGMLALPLDDLVRRETVRRQRRLTWLAAGSLAGMVVTSGLAIAAVQARDEARDQRSEAESLVGFMLGDLKDKLEPLGRLDVLDSVGVRALDYYRKQDRGTLTDQGLAQRSKALTLIGQIANLRGDLDGALKRYQEALAGTAEALRRAPDDQQRIFDHAQNVFWVGYIAFQRGQVEEAERRFLEYRRLAERLVALDPDEKKWQLEKVYADTNLGMLLLEDAQFSKATPVLREALANAERLQAANPRDKEYRDIVFEALAYLADAQEGEGHLDEAIGSRERQLEGLQSAAATDQNDTMVKRRSLSARRALGRLFASRGELDSAVMHLRAGAALAQELRQREPDNTEWLRNAAMSYLDLGALLLASRRVDEAEPSIRAGCEIAQGLLARDPSVVLWVDAARHCLINRGQAAAARGNRGEALALARRAATLSPASAPKKLDPGSLFLIAQAQMLRGDQLAATGDTAGAAAAWTAALKLMSQSRSQAPQERTIRYRIAKRLGREGEAGSIASALDSIGYRHPDFVSERRRNAG